MTNDECLNAVKYIKNEYTRKKDELDAEYKKKTQSALNLWAKENARFGVGDIIKSKGFIIVVEKIVGYHNTSYSNNNLRVDYWGSVLTTKLQKRKDGFKTSLYDEESSDLKLVKKAEV